MDIKYPELYSISRYEYPFEEGTQKQEQSKRTHRHKRNTAPQESFHGKCCRFCIVLHHGDLGGQGTELCLHESSLTWLLHDMGEKKLDTHEDFTRTDQDVENEVRSVRSV